MAGVKLCDGKDYKTIYGFPVGMPMIELITFVYITLFLKGKAFLMKP